MAVKRVGYSGAKVGRFLGAKTSAVNRWAASEELPDLAKHIVSCFIKVRKDKKLRKKVETRKRKISLSNVYRLLPKQLRYQVLKRRKKLSTSSLG
jgi:hypothetical protein